MKPWIAAYDEGVPADVNPPDVPLHRFLDDAAQRWPQNTALTFYESTISYEALRTQAEAFASALQAVGLQSGDRVMLALPNVPQMVIGFFGTLKAGGIAMLVDPSLDSDEIAVRVRQCRPRVVLTLRSLLPTLMEARVNVEHVVLTRSRDYLRSLRGVLASMLDRRGSVAEGRAANVSHLADWLTRFRGRAPQAVAQGLATLCYTSGTVGDPRAVVLTHRNLVANTLQVRLLYTDARVGEEVLLAAVPLWHSYGLSSMNMAVSLGANTILLPTFKSHAALQLIARHRPTLFPAVPAMYVSLINHPLVKRYDLRSIRACLSGASPLAVEVREAFERLTHGRLVEGYGLTEAGPVTHANPFRGVGKPSTIGIPLPGTDARVVRRDNGETAATGEIGELAVRGPQVMLGYWEDDAATRAAVRDGWLYTGDLATMDADGFFQIICRISDVIHVDGHDVYPRDVEEVLYEHPAVREAAVCGILDGGRVVLRAHVVPRFGERTSASDVIHFCRGRLAPHKVPTLVKFETRLPRSPVGKLLRRLL